MINDILNKLDWSKDWGKLCNQIQKIVATHFSDKDWNDYHNKSMKDLDECRDSDFVVFNSHYFDWKEFDYNKRAIVSAYLLYFNDKQLKLIGEKL